MGRHSGFMNALIVHYIFLPPGGTLLKPLQNRHALYPNIELHSPPF